MLVPKDLMTKLFFFFKDETILCIEVITQIKIIADKRKKYLNIEEWKKGLNIDIAIKPKRLTTAAFFFRLFLSLRKLHKTKIINRIKDNSPNNPISVPISKAVLCIL